MQKSGYENYEEKSIMYGIGSNYTAYKTASAAPWQMRRNQLIFDSKIEFLGNVTLAHNGDYKPIPFEEVKN